MDFIRNEITRFNTTLKVYQRCFEFAEKDTDLYYELREKTKVLETRISFLKKYEIVLKTRKKKIHADIDDEIRIKPENNKELENKRAERFKANEKEIEDLLSMLPTPSDQIKSRIVKKTNTPNRVNLKSYTVSIARQYCKKYLNQFNNVSVEKNFFHAAACSQYELYVSTKYLHYIDDHANELLFYSKIQPDVEYPLSLIDIDRIIHSLRHADSDDEDQVFIIYDTALRIIMTNLPERLSETCYTYLLIYNSETKRFAPLSHWTEFNEKMCAYCVRFNLRRHNCSRQCPICLRESDDFRCFKPSPESEAIICPKCNAFCQTKECYERHVRVAQASHEGQTISKVHDDGLHGLLLTSLFELSLDALHTHIVYLNNKPTVQDLAADCERALQEHDPDLPPNFVELLLHSQAALSERTTK